MIGKLVAMSIVQGGSGLPIFHPAVYHYLTTGVYLGQVTADDEVPDPQVRLLLNEVMRFCVHTHTHVTDFIRSLILMVVGWLYHA